MFGRQDLQDLPRRSFFVSGKNPLKKDVKAYSNKLMKLILSKGVKCIRPIKIRFPLLRINNSQPPLDFAQHDQPVISPAR
ncbi:hypothetical protein BIU88_08235 [Chlorobaculum limnaeum]|uniref:Uncharacterized protein n=1 Tax=Chlorobaculum limnaeum TaxID=274537 RepID=A0A1D8CYY8_CHLLM|nr:hypothetical protein BIU88_08235 [Chlorobaculum limnaeum]